MAEPIFEVRDLDVRFSTPDGEVHAVKNVSFDIGEGECLGVVGESGSGKSQLFLAATGLLVGERARHRQRQISRPGNSGPAARVKLNRLRGSRITMIFQDPLTSLTPHMTIGAADHRGAARRIGTCPARRAEKRALRDAGDLCAFPKRAGACANIPTNFPAACASA